MSKTEISALPKEDISTKINDLLGTQGIGFEKMSKDDLTTLFNYLQKLFRPLSEMSLKEFFAEITEEGGGSILLARIRKRVRESLSVRESLKKTS